MVNADYSTIFSNLSLEKINQLEVSVLKIFDFYVEITTQEYDKMQKTIHDLNIAANKLRLNSKIIQTTHGLLSPTSSSKLSISGRHAFYVNPQHSNNYNHNSSNDYDDEQSYYSKNRSPPPPQIEENFPSSDLLTPFLTLNNNTTDTIDEITASIAQESYDGYSEEKRGYLNYQIAPLPTQSLSQNIKNNFSFDPSDIQLSSTNSFNEQNHQTPSPQICDVDDNFENCNSNDPQNDIKDRQENITQNKGPPKRKTSIQIAVDNALLVLVKYLPMPANQSAKIYVTNEIESLSS